MTEKEINYHFSGLVDRLAVTPLPTEKGGTRQAKANEFMLMHVGENGWIGFKHRDTRNYIFLSPNHKQLYVPQTKEPFMLGHFDVFPPPSSPFVAKKGQVKQFPTVEIGY